ncbi:hypothetical protein F5Y12DRAFT_274805 [Xylaria sp. FL1777]|nr:hypothetical protein F5Y12DRAFT_274805 [Xylaria sp. FL1777]
MTFGEAASATARATKEKSPERRIRAKAEAEAEAHQTTKTRLGGYRYYDSCMTGRMGGLSWLVDMVLLPLPSSFAPGLVGFKRSGRSRTECSYQDFRAVGKTHGNGTTDAAMRGRADVIRWYWQRKFFREVVKVAQVMMQAQQPVCAECLEYLECLECLESQKPGPAPTGRDVWASRLRPCRKSRGRRETHQGLKLDATHFVGRG